MVPVGAAMETAAVALVRVVMETAVLLDVTTGVRRVLRILVLLTVVVDDDV